MPTPCLADMPRRITDFATDHFDEIARAPDGTRYLISQRLRVDCLDKPVWFHPNNKAGRVHPGARRVFSVSQFVQATENSPVGYLHRIDDTDTKEEALVRVFGA